MKRLLVWVCVALVVAGAVAAYFTVQPVRRFVDRIVSTFGLAPAREGVIYWCPMHPEITRRNPGTCPV